MTQQHTSDPHLKHRSERAEPHIGHSAVRVDAPGKLSGATEYPSDRIPTDALWATAVFTNQPHARLVSLDFTSARAVDGVVAVLGSADVPVNEYGLSTRDQPVFVGLDHTGRSSVNCDVSRWEADRLALVIAETPEAARSGAAAIDAVWEPLPVLPDIDAALASRVLIHPEKGEHGNICSSYRIRKGDMARGWAEADVTVEGTYEFPYQEHAYLQPEAGLAYTDSENRVTVEIAGQWTHEDQIQIAHSLDLPSERIRVIYPAIGGAFGGREDISIQIVLALAAHVLASRGIIRPVAMIWSREESIVGHHKRHRGRITTRWGAKTNGHLTAISSEAWLDSGAYMSTSAKVLANCHIHQAGPYEVPNAKIDSHAVYTNATPAGAFRGFGAPQAAFAAESQMNKLAKALGIDPVEIRRINALREDSIGVTQTPLPTGVTLPQVIDSCAEATAASAAPRDEPQNSDSVPSPTHHRRSQTVTVTPRNSTPNSHDAAFSPFLSLPPSPTALRRGRGFACGFKNVGFAFGAPESCEAKIALYGDTDIERAVLYHAGAEVGQGAHTVFVQMTAEATGLPSERVECHFSDTATSRDSGSASASRLTWMGGNAILGAAEEAEKAWHDGERPAVGQFRFVPPPTEALDPQDGSCTPAFAYGYVAQCVDLTVDIDTGHIRIDRVTSAHDVGRAINPQQVIGQIEGAVIQAHGYTFTENLRSEAGRLLNTRLSTYLIPGIGDIPLQVESVVLELPDQHGPWGAKGMAEMGIIAYAPAVTAALYEATGIWFDTFPLTPDRVVAGLSQTVHSN